LRPSPGWSSRTISCPSRANNPSTTRRAQSGNGSFVHP
jgi:hypothetical protein